MRKVSVIALYLLLLQFYAYAENSTEFYHEGVEFFKAGNYTAAEASFKKALGKNPSYTLGHYGLGKIYMLQKKKVPDSIKHLKLAVKYDPGFARGWFKLGLAELVYGKYVDSLHSFHEAYEKDRTVIEALYNIGVVYDLLGDEYRAFSYFRMYYRGLKGEKSGFNP